MGEAQVVAFKRRSRSLATELAAHLEQLIVNGHYPAGSALPAERDMAANLGVSRNSLREALLELEAKHLIERHHGKASRVTWLNMDVLAVQERLNSLEDRIQHVIEAENIVEPGLTRLAAERATAADLLQLEAVLERDHAELSPDESLELDIDFHYTLARACRNTFVLGISGLGAERTRETRLFAHITREARIECWAGHTAVFQAIEAGDPMAAEQAMREHLEVVHRYMRDART